MCVYAARTHHYSVPSQASVSHTQRPTTSSTGGNFTMATSIRCTLPSCSCECFAPGKSQLRTCEQCRHGWVAHALDKLSTGHSFPSLCVEVVHSDIVFDITSLILYGTQATPIRLRILLDRLFSVLKSEEVDRILQGLGWGHEDYARGYILQDQDGKVLERWTIATKEEEPIILNQFLRFGETKSIAEVMLQELKSTDAQSAQKKNESDIRAFIERMGSRHKVNSSYDGSDEKRLPSSPEPSRTVQKSLQHAGIHDSEGHSVGKASQTFQPRESSQGSNLPVHNIHLANLEQTVLKAGVVQAQTRARGRISYPNSNSDSAKRPQPVRVNSAHDVPSTSHASMPPLLNSSVSMVPGSVKRFSSFSLKGHRKMTLSKRRAWTPYMTLPNSKQVKCNTCNKWFYDKGTWKIHFGAVHLKVKYRCTVAGCNMAFSSLRSRNRHSANPSPRIHRFVFNTRRMNKRRSHYQEEGMQLQPECETQKEKGIEIEDDDDDVTMVIDDANVKEEENSNDLDEDVALLENERDSNDADCSAENTSEALLETPVPDINQTEVIHENDNCSSDTMQSIKVETADDVGENSDGRESQSVSMELKSSEGTEQVHPASDSPTVHHFKKRKSNAPRRFFIPKQEEDADCQVEGVAYKTEDGTKQNNEIQDAEEEETGIDLEEIAGYENSLPDDDNLSNDYHYVSSRVFSQKVRQMPERIPTSQSQSLENLNLDQDNLHNHVAEQLGIGIDTCFYINAEGLPSCYLCGKTFQSKQTVKVHYQNVHLKLMHACTIDGCNAMFPSRRSRDRHSTNFNLHRKLFEKGVPLKDGFDQIQPSNPTSCPPAGQAAADSAHSSNHALSDSNSSSSSEGIKKAVKQSDSLNEAQVKRIRKKGSKDGTPCQYARCECPDYQSPAGALRNSWLATCTSCRHSESEHRLLTKQDKIREANLEKAHSRPCVGCDADCLGYEKPDHSVPTDSPLAKQCANCKHTIDSHRPETALDKIIKTTFSGCTGLRCHVQMERDDKQMTSLSINECDNAEVGLWFEPTNIDPDDDEGVVIPKMCGCRGFRLDNLTRVCQKYFGFTPDMVAPFLTHTPCQRCSHGLSLHRLPNEQERAAHEKKKSINLTLSGVVSFTTTDTLASQEAVGGLLLPSNMISQSLPQLALATVDSSSECGFSISITLCPASSTDSRSTVEEAGGKKRKKIGQIIKDVKQKVKRRKTNDGVIGSSESESTPDDGKDPVTGDSGFPNKLLRTLTHQVRGQVVIQCGNVAPTALDFRTFEIKRRKTVMLLATGNSQGSVAMYTVSTDDSQKLAIEGDMQCPTAAVSKLALHTCENILYSGHADGTVGVWMWDVVTQQMELMDTRRDRNCRVSAISAATGRKYLAVGYQNGDVLLYEALTKATSSQPTSPTSSSLRQINCCSIAYGAVTSLAWHPDKIIVAAGGEDDCVTVFYMHTPSSGRHTKGTIIEYFSVSPKKHLKPNTFYKCAVLKGHKSFVSNVTFDPRGRFLLSTSWDSQVLSWSTAEIDDIIKIGDEAPTMECFSGFILGQNQRAQKIGGSQGGGCPFVPLWMGILGEGVFTLSRSSPSKVHLVGYELPKKILNCS